MKINRNDPCWCNSGRKYKTCHMNFDEKLHHYLQKGCIVPDHSIIKTAEQIEGIKKSAEVNTGLLDYLTDYVRPGISTAELDHLAYEFTIAHGAEPAPLGYNGFPKSICTSLNDVVCHGIPSGEEILKDGDIVNIDVSTILDSYYSDASRMFTIGTTTDRADHLVRVAKECVEIGLAAVKPWGFLGDIGYAINHYAESQGCSVVRDLGGHGIGLEFHEEPFVSYVTEPGTDMLLAPGLMFTIEPMICEGSYEVYTDETDNWTVYTEDGQLSAQWEYTVLVTEQGAEIISH